MRPDEIRNLVMDNQGLIPFFIKMRFGCFPLPGYTKDECWQMGMIGLFLAARRWNGKNTFATYAQWWIFQVVMDDIQTQRSGFHIGRQLQNRSHALKKYCSQNAIPLANITADNPELLQEMNVNKTRLATIISAAQRSGRLLSLDETIRTNKRDQDGETKRGDRVANSANLWQENESCDDPAKLYEKEELKHKLRQVIANGQSKLTEKQRRLLTRVFLDNLSIASAGQELGMSRSLAHLTITKAIWKIHWKFHEYQ